MLITKALTNFEIEPLSQPFGFKGGALNSLWQCPVYLETESGRSAVGLGSQNTLWSDATLFASSSPAASASMMYLIGEYAAKLLCGRRVVHPRSTLFEILPSVTDFARKITGLSDLRTTFVLNALVGVDHALWKLYEAEQGGKGLDYVLPEGCCKSLGDRHDKLAVIPLISYGVSLTEVRELVENGFFFLKIKMGSDPEKDGDLAKMLEWDKKRLSEVHEVVKDFSSPYTDSGRIVYYLDANGRYDSRDRLMRLLEHADKIGVLERTIVVEEPFPEEYKVRVDDLNTIVAADESAHSAEDVEERISLGYRAIALKPIAKTISVTLDMIETADKYDIPCFCADLTVGPLLLEINKSFAARLKALPGLKIPALESNGWQNYKNWSKLEGYNPVNNRAWSKLRDGIYSLDESFYTESGGMFMDYPHYRNLILNG